MTGDDLERRRVYPSVVVVVVLVAATVAIGWSWTAMQRSSAAFADREIFDRNHLGAGTVDVAAGDATATFAAVNMAAGDSATGRLEVVNRGTLPLSYSLSFSSDSATFDGVFELEAWKGSPGCGDTPPANADRRPIGRTGAVPSDSSAVIGALAPGEAELVCMAGTLPLSAPTSLQGRRIELDVLVRAEHDLEASS